jgi:hypothetical protein
VLVDDLVRNGFTPCLREDIVIGYQQSFKIAVADAA